MDEETMELLTTAITLISKVVVTPLANATISKLNRTELVTTILKELKLDPRHPGPGFDGIYVHTFVEYGTGKPKSVLELFRNKEVKEIFYTSFYNQDRDLLKTRLMTLVDQLALGDAVKAEPPPIW